jgi:hypothetical protein
MAKMKTGFVPIEKNEFVKKYLESNPGESREDISEALDSALDDYKKGVRCACGNELWVVGSAVSGNACFTCITGESMPDDDYEIEEAC